MYSRIRTPLAATFIVGLLAALLAPFTPLSPAPSASAVTGSDWNAGNIISDAVWSNTSTMNVSQIQSFLESQEAGCTASNGYPCLKDFRQDTFSRAASAGRCGAYPGAAGESAATIIFKVSQICGINPQVIIVTLEKEQGLVSSKAPTSWKYQAAMGYGCPDTAPCDAQYYGFYNQVYKGAWQFAEYAAEPDYWRYHPGNVSIQWNPNPACGSTVVNIQNQATANLYNYTPYQPNAAALNNLYGTGDSCSAYGNRNFWVTFNNWFGSTQFGGNMFRTAADPNVYVVSGNVKHLVSSMALLSTLYPLGPVGIVDPSFLASKTTGAPMSRIVGTPTGDLYFVDQGRKYHFDTCDKVVAWGIACASYVPLTSQQVAAFSGNTTMTNAVHVYSNYYFLISGGKRAQAADATTLSAALPGTITELSDDAVSSLPYASPLLRDNIALRNGPTDNYGLFFSGSMTSVSGDLYRGSRLSSAFPAITFESPSFGMVPKRAGSLNGVITAGSGNSVLTPTGRLPIGSATWGVPPTTVSPAIYNALPADITGTAPTKSFVVAPGSPSVYLVDGGIKRILPSWSDYLSASRSVPDPTIRTIAAAAAAQIPNGPALLAPGAYILDPSGRTYLADGSSHKLYVPSALVVNSLGLGTARPVSQAVSDSLATSGTIGTTVTCAGTTYFGTGDGVLRALPASIGTAYGIGGSTTLDAATCATLRLSSTAVTKFATTPNGSVYVADGGSLRWVSSMSVLTGLGGSASTLTPFTAEAAAAYPTGSPALSTDLSKKPLFLQPQGGSTVYWLDKGALRQLLSWSDYLAVSASAADKTIYATPTTLTTALPVGAPYLSAGSVVRTSGAPEVYLIDGQTKIHISNAGLLDAAGVPVSLVPNGSLSGLPTAAAPLSQWLGCPAGTVLAIGGSLRALTGDAASRYAPGTVSTLASATCAALPVSSTGPGQFIRDPGGAIYQMVSGTKRHILSMATYTSLGGSNANTTAVSVYTAGNFPNGADLP